MTVYIFDGPVFNDFSMDAAKMNPVYLRVSNQLDVLRQRGIAVKRYNLKEHAIEFTSNKVVIQQMMSGGEQALPIVLLDDEVLCSGQYLTDEQFASLLKRLG